MSYLQLLVGSNINFFHLPYTKYAKGIKSSWLTSLWDCVSKVKFTLRLKNSWTPDIQRINDVMLMDYFITLKYKPKTLQVLNRCRIYLQVLSLSDITSADGKEIIPQVLIGDKLSDRKSNLEWPTQQKHPKNNWIIWASALNHIHTRNRLKNKLTTWLSEPHQSWFWYMNPIRSIIYHNPYDNIWYSGAPLPSDNKHTRSKSRPTFSTNNLTETTPPR
jgi:hypothetical protein